MLMEMMSQTGTQRERSQATGVDRGLGRNRVGEEVCVARVQLRIWASASDGNGSPLGLLSQALARRRGERRL